MKPFAIDLSMEQLVDCYNQLQDPDNMPEGKIPQMGFELVSPDGDLVVEFGIVPSGLIRFIVRAPYGSYAAMEDHSYDEISTGEHLQPVELGIEDLKEVE